MILELYIGGAVIFYMTALLYRFAMLSRVFEENAYIGLPRSFTIKEAVLGAVTRDVLVGLLWPAIVTLLIVAKVIVS